MKGDFRQKEILNQWQKMLPFPSDRCFAVTFKKKKEYHIAKIKISCSSGTYIRSIAHHLGKKLKTGSVILSLTRTKVSDFKIKDSIKI